MGGPVSVQKLIAEADKLFEKGKYPDGIAKLKSAVNLEPLNQIVATKLANTLIQNRDTAEAAKVYGGLAKRLSDAGKNQVAIAIYKQALELTPDDIQLRMRFAQECESIGKLGDAFLQGQICLNYFIRRKKFFDASNILPMMARAQPKDEKIKIAWVEIMQLCQAEQKLAPLLVALCGPPGLQAPEFPQGGDPETLSPALYEGLKKLVPFFPRDPKVAYAIAWCAYRRGRRKEFYSYLHECLRREPDFCLAILLFARVLAEDKRLNEAMFLYRYYRERMTADKNTDMLTLNRQMESFVEKNGWIKFVEDSGDLLDTPGFFKAMTGEESKVEEKKEELTPEEIEEREKTGSFELPPAEVELGGGGGGDLEVVTTTGQAISDVKGLKKGPANDPMRMQAELIKATIEAAVAGIGGAAPHQTQQTVVQPVILPAIQAAVSAQAALTPETIAKAREVAQKSMELGGAGVPPETPVDLPSEDPSEAETGLIEKGPDRPKSVADARAKSEGKSESKAKAPKPAPESTEPSLPAQETETTGEIEGFKGESVEFTSLVKFDPSEMTPGSGATPAPDESTRMAPLTEDGATQVAVPSAAPEKTRVATPEEDGRTMMKPLEDEAEQIEQVEDVEGEDGAAKKLFNPLEGAGSAVDTGSSLRLENTGDERTQMFSPMDVLDAAKVMQNRDLSEVETKNIVVEPQAEEGSKPSMPSTETLEADKTKWRELKVEGERTTVFSPVEAVQAGVDSRRPMDAVIKAAEPKPPEPAPSPETAATPTVPPGTASSPAEQATTAAVVPSDMPADFTAGEATVVFQRPKPGDAPPPSPPANAQTGKVAVDPATPEAGGSREVNAPPAEATAAVATDASAPGAPQEGAFMPIPTAAATARPGAGEEKIDLGDDLLEGPTRIFTQPTAADKTEHLIKEIKSDLKNKANSRVNIDMLMKKAERYTAKRNYYLARKALRHAQALGADEETVKAKLREIRKLELPDGLYNTISSDNTEAKVDTADVLERLEQEFDLSDGEGAGELGHLVEKRIEAIFTENDPRTILDFGVGLHEMGLFRQAENLFIRLVEEFPDHAFDAYYLAAISKLSRRDYAGAASILKRLSGDNAKTELDKIQIYYALGETFEKMRQRDRSRKMFKKVAELDANYRNIRQKLDE